MSNSSTDKSRKLTVSIARSSGLTVGAGVGVFGLAFSHGRPRLPQRQVELLNGKKFTERTSATYKLLRRTDDAAFTKP